MRIWHARWFGKGPNVNNACMERHAGINLLVKVERVAYAAPSNSRSEMFVLAMAGRKLSR
jgi:hypothetical protein